LKTKLSRMEGVSKKCSDSSIEIMTNTNARLQQKENKIPKRRRKKSNHEKSSTKNAPPEELRPKAPDKFAISKAFWFSPDPKELPHPKTFNWT